MTFFFGYNWFLTLEWRHNELDGISNHWSLDCLLDCLFWHRSKKTSNLCVTGLCVGNSPVTGEFPAQRASNSENVPIWWHRHEMNEFLLPNYRDKITADMLQLQCTLRVNPCQTYITTFRYLVWNIYFNKCIYLLYVFLSENNFLPKTQTHCSASP